MDRPRGLSYNNLGGWLDLALVPAGCLVFLFKLIHAAGGIDQFLSSGEERVAGGADFHADIAFVRGTGFECIAAGADNIRLVIYGMNSSFHGKEKDPFENFSIAKIRNPVDPKTHGVQVA
jgi:hypothetical protein